MAKKATVADPENNKDLPVCGIVMPISSTGNHSSDHWVGVLELVHRAVVEAGLTPKNVWVGASTDRITERILTNLFEADVVVCDITDLNANVMLELGIRLSSKKPTLVISEEGGTVPFDIKDFQALIYPTHLSMLRMEEFLRELSEQIREKYEAYVGKTYRPFLADVATLDVLEPQAREVPFEKLVVSQLSEVADRIARLESQGRRGSLSEGVTQGTPRTTLYLVVPASRAGEAVREILDLPPGIKISRFGERAGDVAFALTFERENEGIVGPRLNRIAKALGGARGLPPKFQDISPDTLR